MTVKQHLEDFVSRWIAKELWGKMSTELDKKITGELADEHVRYPWMMKRMEELLKEYLHEKETTD